MPASWRPTPAVIMAKHPVRSIGRCRSGRRGLPPSSLAVSKTKIPMPIVSCRRRSHPSDPCSAWTAKANKRVQFGYGLNYMIDVEHAVIVDVEATPARTYDEVAATRTMIDRTETTFGLKPGQSAADTAHGRASCSPGSWTRTSPRIFRWRKDTSELTACSLASTLLTTLRATVYLSERSAFEDLGNRP